MKHFIFKKFLPSLAKRIRETPSHRLLPENALFWMLLVLLSIGSAASLYSKANAKDSRVSSRDIHMSASKDSAAKPETSSRNHKVKNRQLPIYCVQSQKPMVALSFDAAWGNEDTRQIMDILSKYNVKATFFMTGGWVEKYPDDVKYIASQGHDLGNHSENHKNMSQLEKDEILSEIQSVHSKVKTLTGIDMQLFRPPYGDFDNDVITSVLDTGYYPIQWDVDSLDWKDYGTDSIIKTVLENEHLGNGSIILMHNGAKYTPKALETIITGLQQKGFELIPISQLIIKDHYHLDHEGRQLKD